MSASRDYSPEDAVKLKQRESSFPFAFSNNGIVLKEKHQYYTQVQMQMAVTKRNMCHLVIFTAMKFDIHVCKIPFNQQFWVNTKDTLLNFHSTYVVPALVESTFKIT